MPIKLIIKGNTVEAHNAATLVGVRLNRVVQHELHKPYVETLAECADEFWPQVRAWYHSEPKNNPPYSDGTLMWCDCDCDQKRVVDAIHDTHTKTN